MYWRDISALFPGSDSPPKHCHAEVAGPPGANAWLLHFQGLHYRKLSHLVKYRGLHLNYYQTISDHPLLFVCFKCVSQQQYGLANEIEAANSYTVFAPNDDAIENYLSEKNISTLVRITHRIFLNNSVSHFSVKWMNWKHTEIGGGISFPGNQ